MDWIVSAKIALDNVGTMMPTILLRLLERLPAALLPMNFSSLAAASTFFLVAGLTKCDLLKARDAVIGETPASRATSRIVTGL